MTDLDLTAIGARLRDVRGRLTQAAFADQLGLERKTVGRYEAGERAPDALALLRLMAEFDVDPAWVLTGKGFAPTGTEDERELLALYRSAPLTGKMAAVGALQGAMGAATGSSKQVINGGVAQAVNAQSIGKQVNVIANTPGAQAAGRKIVNKREKS